MLVKPAPGLQVRDPRTRRVIPAEGIEVEPGDLTFVRLLNSGDVVEDKPESPPAPAPEKPAQEVKAPEPKPAATPAPAPPAPEPEKTADAAKGA